MENTAVRILILEDVPSDAELIEHILRNAGLELVRFLVDDRKSFIESLAHFSPDIILSDYSLPGFDGQSALKVAREIVPDVPFIFVTGAVGEEFAVELLKSGATDIVLKDRLSRLSLSVKRALEEAEERRTRIRAEEDLRKAHQRLITVQEEERRSMARELHDSVGSCLMAIKLAVENEVYVAEKERDDARMSRLGEITSMIEEAFSESKRMQKQLRPSVLDDFGIVAAVQSLCRDFQSWHSSIHVQAALEIGEEDVPEDLKITVYRVLQEGLNNVAKHSGATWVLVSLSSFIDRIQLVVQDQGKGFDLKRYEESRTESASMGIMGMRERTRLSGGTCSIETTPGEGTTIRASWPIRVLPPLPRSSGKQNMDE
ncbi:MAG: response regulator [Desulfobacteraceae bacterium]|nr:MAG: response regulator [Desulfobacteraceae bacterium]